MLGADGSDRGNQYYVLAFYFVGHFAHIKPTLPAGVELLKLHDCTTIADRAASSFYIYTTCLKKVGGIFHAGGICIWGGLLHDQTLSTRQRPLGHGFKQTAYVGSVILNVGDAGDAQCGAWHRLVARILGFLVVV